MSRLRILTAVGTSVLTICIATLCIASPDAVIDVYADKPTIELPDTLYGVFYEDINHAADGGLYAELVQNRSFANYPIGQDLSEGAKVRRTGAAWEKIERGGGVCRTYVDDKNPLNKNNTEYLVLKIENPGSGVGVANTGFAGIYVVAGDVYDFSFYAGRTGSREEDFNISIENESGNPVGRGVITEISGEWKKYTVPIKVAETCEKAKLVITTTGEGEVYMDMISLFPQKTFKNRKNGLRPDLVQTLIDLKPGVFRFPGGCIVHGGWDIKNAYRWKDTIGDVAERKANWNLWGYNQSYGLGYYEYFLLCEDLGAEPMPVLPVGVGCGFRNFQFAPMDELQPWIDDAVDLIDFANGSADTKWGKIRAELGHKEPFNMKYICLGNEEHDTKEFRERLPYFVKAIREKDPKIKIIGTSGLGPGIPLYEYMFENGIELSDEHYYDQPEWFIRNRNRFDDFDRSKPKVFVGEYASNGNTLYNAVSEAVYLTGVEKNADMVAMTAYAPTFARYNFTQWIVNLIFFDHKTVVLTPNYHVQRMFSGNKGDRYLENKVSYTVKEGKGTNAGSGAFGVGTWATQAEFDDIKITDGENTLFEESFSAGADLDWQVQSGSFEVRDGVYAQTGENAPAISLSGKEIEAEKTVYSLRARKTGGAEGFLIVFGKKGAGVHYWWNIGGWGNTQHGIAKGSGDVNGGKTNLAERNGKIETDKWYDIRIETDGSHIKCFLNGELIHDVVEANEAVVAVSATEDKTAGEVILKIANSINADLSAKVNLHGVKSVSPEASLIVMKGAPDESNDLQNPERIKPTAGKIPVAVNFDYQIPASSVQVIRIKTAF